jgi:hypothetical protein
MTSSAPRFANPKAAVLAAGLAVALAMTSMVRADRPSAPRLLPKTTVAYVSIPDVPDATERFMNTSTGRMSQDPQLKPLLKEVYGSVAQFVDTLKDRIGLSLSEILAIPQGQITVALVTPDEVEPALVVILDTGDQLSRAQGLLERVTEAANRSGVERIHEKDHDTPIVIFDGVGRRGRQVSYFEKDGTIVAASNLDVLKQILAVWNGEKGSTLADNRKFTTIMSRCGDPSQKPQLVWFADPIELMRAFGRDNAGIRIAVAMLPSLGLDGISAVGGTSRMDVDEFDGVGHAHLLLEHPRDGVLEAIAFSPGDTTPESWVPADIVSYMTVRLDLEKAYKTLEELFNSFQGDGALAASIETRINGPLDIDLHEDLLSALTGRLTYVNWIERPVTIQSSANLIAFELKNEAELDKVLEKLQARFENFLLDKSYGGNQYYKISPPGLQEQLAEARPGQMAPQLPCFGIVDRSLIVADRESLYKKVVVTSKESTDKLADAVDYKLITAKITRQGGGAAPVMITFARPEESMRFMYDLANADQTRQFLDRQARNNPFLKSLNSAFQSHPLPPFAVLEQYLAPSGGLVLEDETGLHYIGFTLKPGGK